MSLARVGIPLTEEHKAKVGMAGKGRIVSEATKLKVSEAIKKHWEKRRLVKESR
jgi:hypothetical protein